MTNIFFHTAKQGYLRYVRMIFLAAGCNLAIFGQAQLPGSLAADSLHLTSYLRIPVYPAPAFRRMPVSTEDESVTEAASEKEKAGKEIRSLLGISEAHIALGKNGKAFADIRRLLQLKHLSDDSASIARLYYDAGVVLARMKKYPLAMSCLYKAGQINPGNLFTKRKNFYAVNETTVVGEPIVETAVLNSKDDEEVADTDLVSDSLLNVSLDQLQADTIEQVKKVIPQPVDPDLLLDAFDDGKKARAFAFMIHVKQPSPGENKAFAGLGEVGHMFITLIKYNRDRSVVCRTFGFYPQHGLLFSANPIFPSAPRLIKADSAREWDEMIGRFISKAQFKRVLAFVNAASEKSYHLSKFNCSDFALDAAKMASIQIEDTKGSWPLGRGNNPGSAGYSILLGKFRNTDAGSKDGLIAIINHVGFK